MIENKNGLLSKEQKLDLVKKLRDKKWRLFSGELYKIVDKDGNKIPFIPNKHQEYLYDNLHNKNIILKARQMGFTTFIAIMALDYAIFNSNKNIGIIAHKEKSSVDIFKNKIKLPLDGLPKWLRNLIEVGTDRAGELHIENFGNEEVQSTLSVDLSFRSGTLQFLHISEYGKICNNNPDRAEEIVSGALNTIGKNGFVFIESTAEGSSGDFYEKCKEAMEKAELGIELSELDYKFFFFPWFLDESYTTDSKFIKITDDTISYFEKLKKDTWILKNYPDIEFSEDQMKWYQAKRKEQGNKMLREFPSTPKESFEVPIEGSIYEKETAQIEVDGRVQSVSYNKKYGVSTAWDLGNGNDDTIVWFYQFDGTNIRVIDYFESTQMSMHEIVENIIKKKGYRYDYHYIPWDAAHRQGYYGKTRESEMRKALNGVVKLDYLDVADGINEVRKILPICLFDEDKCRKGFMHLKNYKREFDEKNGIFKSNPLHNKDSHASDAFRYLSIGFVKDNPEVVLYHSTYGFDENYGDYVPTGITFNFNNDKDNGYMLNEENNANDENLNSIPYSINLGNVSGGLSMFNI